MGVKSVCSVSFGVVCVCGSCLTIFVLGTATMRVKAFVFGFAIFLASAKTVLLVISINSSAAHFISSSTRDPHLSKAEHIGTPYMFGVGAITSQPSISSEANK